MEMNQLRQRHGHSHISSRGLKRPQGPLHLGNDQDSVQSNFQTTTFEFFDLENDSKSECDYLRES